MKKVKTLLMTAIVVVMTFAPIVSAGAYSIDTTYNQMRSTQRTTNNYIILHETGGVAPAINNAQYFNREWRNAGTYSSHVVGDGGDVYQISPEGYVQWGAGSYANARSPVQIELARTNDKATFEKDYKAYVNLARDMAQKYNIPLTLDGNGRGIKSHLWVSQNIWGDHTDPFGYLAEHGVSRADLAQDLRTGLDSSNDVDAEPESPAPGESAPEPDPDSDDYQNTSGSYTFQHTTKIRNSLGTSGGYTGINYDAGQSVNYDRVYRDVDGYDWLSYISYGGQRRYVAMTNNSNSGNGGQSQSGSYTFQNTTRIRNGLGTGASYSGRNYSAGQTVHYDRIYRNVNGYDWLSYISYSGQRRYVAMTNGRSTNSSQQNTSGSYTFRNTTKIRSSLGINGSYTGKNYSPGQTVHYDRIHRNVNGYDWLSYISFSGQRQYVAMTN